MGKLRVDQGEPNEEPPKTIYLESPNSFKIENLARTYAPLVILAFGKKKRNIFYVSKI